MEFLSFSNGHNIVTKKISPVILEVYPELIDTKGFSMDFGSIGPPQQHTKNLGKYSFRKGIIFNMVSKMATGS